MLQTRASAASPLKLLFRGRIKLVIFDVDGTLYDQRQMRLRMTMEMLRELAWSRAGRRKVRIVHTFRRVREELAEQEATDVVTKQYAETAGRLGVPAREVRTVTDEWLEQRPLAFLCRCREAGIEEVFGALRGLNVSIAVLSDYPARDKLRVLGLGADIVVSAVDEEVSRFKPHPQGLRRILDALGQDPDGALLIGDRPERDGECAARCGAHFLLKTRARRYAGSDFSKYSELISGLSIGHEPSSACEVENARFQ